VKESKQDYEIRTRAYTFYMSFSEIEGLYMSSFLKAEYCFFLRTKPRHLRFLSLIDAKRIRLPLTAIMNH